MAETPAVCEQLHLPLQSGSDRILQAMRRGYTAERYLSLLADARAAIGDLAVTTDIIVGYPGETEEDFEGTLEVASQAQYDSAYTFIFSPRPGTRAAEMTDLFVPPEVIADRFERLKVVIERSALARNMSSYRSRRAGHRRRPVQEGPRGALRSDPPGQARAFRASGGRRARSRHLRDVRVAQAAPHHLAGALVSRRASLPDTAGPRADPGGRRLKHAALGPQAKPAKPSRRGGSVQ